MIYLAMDSIPKRNYTADSRMALWGTLEYTADSRMALWGALEHTGWQFFILYQGAHIRRNETHYPLHRNGGMFMNIGFIGAGKVGVTLGKYLTERGVKVTGYYSKTFQSALEAANFTNTRAYEKLRFLVEDSDTIFLAVPDGAIASVWEKIKVLPIENKIISHFSGSLSSAVFSDIDRYRAYGYSIHPLFAINDKYNSYKELSRAFFTIEGHEKYLSQLQMLFSGFGNQVALIDREDKMLYHACAAMASNLYVGLVWQCEQILMKCGFSREHAHQALIPLIQGNTENIVKYGPKDALTGPIERNDLSTVLHHLEVLTGEDKEVYKILSRQVLHVAEEKHKNRDYKEIEGAFKSLKIQLQLLRNKKMREIKYLC